MTRQWFDGPIALSGAIGNGRAIRAARLLGADFAYIGSAFIATSEANAVEGYKQMITSCTAEDIVYSNLFTGVHGNYLKPSIVAAGMDGASSDPDLARLSGLALVQCLVSRGETDKAVPVTAQLEAKYPDDADVLYQAARLHMKAFNDVTHRMFERTPASYRVNQLSAEIFETQNRFAEAAAEYRKAIQKNPQALDLHFRLGRAILLESHEPGGVVRGAPGVRGRTGAESG